MSEASEHLELLKNAVRQPIAALTAVETDTVYQAKELAKMLAAEIGERPNETLSMAVEDGAAALLYQARRISENWTDDQGVLFVIDDGGKDAEKRYPFWVEMNALRESWAALNCHVIFFLLPHNYRMMLQVADHLADWISLRLRLMSEKNKIDEYFLMEDRLSFESELSPKVARQQLSLLEEQLTEALQKEIEPLTLIRHYYLPMLQASVELHDLHRSQSLREKISENAIPENDLPQWWYTNGKLDYHLRRLYYAKKWAIKFLKWAIKINNIEMESKALHALGVMATEQKDFKKAEEWLNQSLEIEKGRRNEKGVAIAYHQLGNIAQSKHNFRVAEKLYYQTLKITEKQGFDFSSAITYCQLGMISSKQQDFEKAEEWLNKALAVFEKYSAENRIARVCYHLGTIMQQKHDIENAEKFYKKALNILKKQGDEHRVSGNYQRLGILARLQERFESSGEWLIKSIKAFENTNDPENARKAKDEFRTTHAQASPDVQAKLKEMWDAAGLNEP